MKIVIAPDSFKESLTAKQAADAIEKGFRTAFHDVTILKVPMADGGEGTVQSLVDGTDGKVIHTTVTGPLQNQVQAFYGLLGDHKTAVIEMAAASGLHHVPATLRNPLITTTEGTGELIQEALKCGVERVIIGIGGSATNDGGAGMAYALGVRFFNKEGNSFYPYAHLLKEIETIDIRGMDPRLQEIEFVVACDVSNPLTGPNGASYVYGPQKGATPLQVDELDQNLHYYGEKLSQLFHEDIATVPGSGAAGGLGAGLLAFLNAKLMKGIEIVIQATNLEEKLKDADLVITGEGQINDQTPFGKTPIGVAQLAKKYNIPVIAIAGSYVKGYELVYDYGIDAVFSSIPTTMTITEAFRCAKENVEETAVNVARLYALGRNKQEKRG